MGGGAKWAVLKQSLFRPSTKREGGWGIWGEMEVFNIGFQYLLKKFLFKILIASKSTHSMWGLRKIYDIWSSRAYFFKNCETQPINGYYMQQVVLEAVKNSLSKSSMGLRDNSIGCGTGFCEILTISNWALAQGQNSFLPCKLKKRVRLDKL